MEGIRRAVVAANDRDARHHQFCSLGGFHGYLKRMDADATLADTGIILGH